MKRSPIFHKRMIGAVAVAVGLMTSSALAQGTLVVSGFGGLWEQAVRQAVIEPFQERYGVQVTHAIGGASSEVLARLRAEGGRPSFDVVNMGGGFERIAVEEGLLVPLDPELVPNLADVHEELVFRGTVVANSVASVGIAYHTERVPREPTSWVDFWDPEFGRVGISDITVTYGRALFALVNELEGGTREDHEPGWAKFEELMRERQPLITSTTDETVNVIVARGATMSMAPNSRAIQLIDEGFPLGFVYPEEGAFAWGTFMGVAAGSGNEELAMQFINFWLEPDVQANFARLVNYSPANTQASMPDDYEYSEFILTAEELATAYLLDFDYLNQHMSEWNERWTEDLMVLLR
jgi:putative spermidine/putrescine transport system substrate-binding protein